MDSANIQLTEIWSVNFQQINGDMSQARESSFN